MALILKNGKTYKSPSDGFIQTAYANIKVLPDRDLNRKVQGIQVDIYSSEAARDAGSRPVEDRRYEVSGDDFDKFFANSIIEQAGKSCESQAYSYVMQHEVEDGIDEETGQKTYRLEWLDWMSDE